MPTRHASPPSPHLATAIPPAPQAAAAAPLAGIESMMAEALMALDRAPSGAGCAAGAIEYASWMRLLRRSTP